MPCRARLHIRILTKASKYQFAIYIIKQNIIILYIDFIDPSMQTKYVEDTAVYIQRYAVQSIQFQTSVIIFQVKIIT